MRAGITMTLDDLRKQLQRSSVVAVQNGRLENEVYGAVTIVHNLDNKRVLENFHYCPAKKVYALRQFGVSVLPDSKTNDFVNFVWARGNDTRRLHEIYRQLFQKDRLLATAD